jgi:hypothetical protein
LPVFSGISFAIYFPSTDTLRKKPISNMTKRKKSIIPNIVRVFSLHGGPSRSVARRGGRPALFFVLLLILAVGSIAHADDSPYAPSAGPIAGTNASPISLSESPTWIDIRAGLTTPELIEQYLDSCRITYKEERASTLNHTQSPEETIKGMSGDCEDYAALIADALIYHGYEAGLISVEAKTSGGLLIHAVAVYRDATTGRWHYIHGYRFKGLTIGVSKGFDTQVDLASYIAEKMNGKLYQYFVMSPDAFKRVYDAMLN